MQSWSMSRRIQGDSTNVLVIQVIWFYYRCPCINDGQPRQPRQLLLSSFIHSLSCSHCPFGSRGEASGQSFPFCAILRQCLSLGRFDASSPAESNDLLDPWGSRSANWPSFVWSGQQDFSSSSFWWHPQHVSFWAIPLNKLKKINDGIKIFLRFLLQYYTSFKFSGQK